MNLDSWAINYEKAMRAAGSPESDEFAALSRELSCAWVRAYRRSVRHTSRICVIRMTGFEYIFDDASPASQKESSAEADLICERVVAVYGCSQPSAGRARPASRIRGFPRGAASAPEIVESIRHDRGHMMAHACGGGEDINLFPQLTDVNRGWSREGKTYREMERCLASNPGTFCFSRPIYSGPTETIHTSWSLASCRPTAIFVSNASRTAGAGRRCAPSKRPWPRGCEGERPSDGSDSPATR